MRLSAGDRLGPYEIRSVLGAGGMGEVYRAHDTRLKRDVALKVLAAKLANSPEAAKRFEREARAIAAVSHPNIVSIFELGIHGESPFVATELLDGQTLRAGLKMPWRRAVEVAACVCDGLAAAHAHRIIHRDLKPDNIYITSDGRVKILDFGIAHVMEAAAPAEQTTSDETPTAPIGRAIGTIGYAAPEQLTSGTATPATDIFSLGVVLYEMVSGRRPFERASSAETIAAVLYDDPPALAHTQSHIQPALDRIIRRCLQKNPEERFQSARDLGYELRGVVNDAEVPLAGLPRKWVYAGAIALTLAIAIPAFLYRPGAVSAENRLPITSVAILPLANTTRDPNLDYVSDGITDSLINQLSMLQNVRITARPTAFRYKAKDINPVRIGKELGVAALATGRVDVHGDSIVIAADLIDAKSGAELWGNTYRRARDDVTTLPGEIARQIAGELRIQLTAPEQARMLRPPTTSAAAFDLYLRGLQARNLSTKQGLADAIHYLQAAIEADPEYARAWATLAEAYTFYGRYADAHAMRVKAREALERALRIDPDLAEAHVSAGMLHLTDEWNFHAAESEFKSAIAANPNLASARFQYGSLLTFDGRFAEAMVQARLADRLDPLSRMNKNLVAEIFLVSGRVDAAIGALEPLVRTEPDFADAHSNLATAYEEKGRPDDACREYVKFDEVAYRDPQAVKDAAEACRTSGLTGYFRHSLDYYLAQAPVKEPYAVAMLYMRAGDKKQAYAYLDKAYEARSHNMIVLKCDPVFRSIRNEPRFRELLTRVGFDLKGSDELLAAKDEERGQGAVVKSQHQVSDSR